MSDDLQRLTVLFVHSEEEQREHDDNHPHSSEAQVAGAFEKEKGRYADKRCRPKAQKLPFCQPKEHLRLDPCKVTGNRNIRSQSSRPPFPAASVLPPFLCRRSVLVSGQDALCDASCLEQREHQQHCIAHHAPNTGDNIVREGYRLHQNCIDADAYNNQESLEAKSEQASQIVLTDLALFPIAERRHGDGSEAGQQ